MKRRVHNRAYHGSTRVVNKIRSTDTQRRARARGRRNKKRKKQEPAGSRRYDRRQRKRLAGSLLTSGRGGVGTTSKRNGKGRYGVLWVLRMLRRSRGLRETSADHSPKLP